MFPYPSGAGLHVGHPLGYIASDIYSRYKRLQGLYEKYKREGGTITPELRENLNFYQM